MSRKLQTRNGFRQRQVATLTDAVKFIDGAGFCTLFPVANVPLPSLYCALTGRDANDGVVFDKHFETIWHWKDELPRRQRALYAKYFRGKGTFISRRQLPHFLAMRETAAAPHDHERFYRQGRIHDDARLIWQALAEHGPLATLELRHACKMETTAGNVRFKRAILDLQCLLVISHFGSEQETGAWASGKYELTCRAFPEETSAAFEIEPDTARAKLAAKFAEANTGAQPMQLARLFGWTKAQALAALGAGKATDSARKPRSKKRR
ncbi:MAG: AlkZ-related protein [Candidatus Acidiferrales bacterium]